MLIAIIAAMDRNRLIGDGDRLPWRLPADMRRFRALTMGKPIIMGRRTHESIGKALPGRKNIVLSRNPDYRAPGCVVVADLQQALDACEDAQEAMVSKILAKMNMVVKNRLFMNKMISITA